MKIKLTESKLKEIVRDLLKENVHDFGGNELTVSTMKEKLEKLEAQGFGHLAVLFQEPNEYYTISASANADPELGIDEHGNFIEHDEWDDVEREYPGHNAVVFS